MRIPLVVALSVAGCVALSFATQLSAQRPQAPRPQRNGTALVDMTEIMKNSTRFHQLMEQLKKQYEAEAQGLKRQGERGNQLTEELRRLPANSPERKRLEEEIMKMRADYELAGKRVTNEIREAESKIVMELVNDLKRELGRYSQATGAQLILRYDPTPPDLTDPRMILQEIHKPIVYQSGLDVTPAILGELNRGAAAPAAAPQTGRAPARTGYPPR